MIMGGSSSSGWVAYAYVDVLWVVCCADYNDGGVVSGVGSVCCSESVVCWQWTVYVVTAAAGVVDKVSVVSPVSTCD